MRHTWRRSRSPSSGKSRVRRPGLEAPGERRGRSRRAASSTGAPPARAPRGARAPSRGSNARACRAPRSSSRRGSRRRGRGARGSSAARGARRSPSPSSTPPPIATSAVPWPSSGRVAGPRRLRRCRRAPRGSARAAAGTSGRATSPASSVALREAVADALRPRRRGRAPRRSAGSSSTRAILGLDLAAREARARACRSSGASARSATRELGRGRRAVAHLAREADRREHVAHRVDGDHADREPVAEAELRARHREEPDQLVGAVLAEEVVGDLDVVELPEVEQHELDLLRREIERVLPDVAVLPVARRARASRSRGSGRSGPG